MKPSWYTWTTNFWVTFSFSAPDALFAVTVIVASPSQPFGTDTTLDESLPSVLAFFTVATLELLLLQVSFLLMPSMPS